MATKVIWIINQYASTSDTGIGGRHYSLAQELSKQGHKVFLISASYTHTLLHPRKVDKVYTAKQCDGFTFVWVKVSQYSDAHSKKRVFNWLDFAWKLRGLKNFIADRPDLVLYSSPSLIGYLGAKHLADFYRARLAFEIRDIWPLTLVELGGYSPNHPFIRFLQWIEDKAYRDADVVISNLKNSVNHMAERGMSVGKFVWIPNGFSLNEIGLSQPLAPSVAEQMPKNKFIVGYAGTLGVANALDVFIESAEILKNCPEIAFVLVGKGKEKNNLQALVHQKKLENVFFIDAIPKSQVQSILGLFNVCFIGLTKDPLFRFGVSPNKLFDYFYAAKPIVYAIESGDYTPVTDSMAGIQVPAQNAKSVADAILELYRLAPEERERMGRNGYRYAMENHEYGHLAGKLAKALFQA